MTMKSSNAKLSFLLLWICLISLNAHAQEKHTISGYLKDGTSGEELLYARVTVPELQNGATTNEFGFYSLTLPAGKHQVVFSYLGYLNDTLEVDLIANQSLTVELQPEGVQMEEVLLTDKIEAENVKSTEMGVTTITPKEAKLVPVLFGEQDIVKTLQLMPGVSSSSEGSSGMLVRGGDPDQNLILLDDAPVYNASHLLGFFSVFNSDALKDVKLYKGTQPAQYGGRVSSVLDVRMKNGNNKKWEATAGLGIISSRLMIEGPFHKDKGSIMVAGRTTYADFLLRTFSDQFSDLVLNFYDINAKANYSFSDNDKIFVSGYFGRDNMGIGAFKLDWGNVTGTVRWNHIFNEKLFANTSLIYTDYDYGFGVERAGNSIELSSGIQDFNLKQDYTYFLNPNNTIQFGWNGIYHRFNPGEFSITSVADEADSLGTATTIDDQQAFGVRNLCRQHHEHWQSPETELRPTL